MKKNIPEKMPDNIWAYERCVYHMDRAYIRLWVITIVLILTLVLTNLGWFIYDSQYETAQETSVEQDIEAGEGDTIISGIGDINYGTDKKESNGD